MAGTLSKKGIPKVVVLPRRISNLEEVARRERRAGYILAPTAATAAAFCKSAKPLPPAPLTMAERVSAFEAGGSLITNEKFEFSRPRCRDLRPHGMVRTPIPRIDPSDFE